MGDVAMMVPVVYSLAKAYPDLRITVLSSPFARTFFESLAPNLSFMAADVKKEYNGIKGLNALYRRLVAKRFTAIADFHGVLRSRFLRMRFSLDRYKVAHIDKHRLLIVVRMLVGIADNETDGTSRCPTIEYSGHKLHAVRFVTCRDNSRLAGAPTVKFLLDHIEIHFHTRRHRSEEHTSELQSPS